MGHCFFRKFSIKPFGSSEWKIKYCFSALLPDITSGDNSFKQEQQCDKTVNYVYLLAIFQMSPVCLHDAKLKNTRRYHLRVGK